MYMYVYNGSLKRSAKLKCAQVRARRDYDVTRLGAQCVFGDKNVY